MPKKALVGIKLFVISDKTHHTVQTEQYSSNRAMVTQFKQRNGNTVQTECSKTQFKLSDWECNVNRVIELSIYRVKKVIEEVSFYRVTLYLPSHQWLPSSKQFCMISMNRVPTPTECMTMPSNVVDAEYQKVIKPA